MKSHAFRDEFVHCYLDTQQRLRERLDEVFKKITDHKRQRDEMEEKYNELKVSGLGFKLGLSGYTTPAKRSRIQ